MEARTAHGSDVVLGGCFLLGGDGRDGQQGEEEQTKEKRQELSGHGTFSQEISAAVIRKSITAGDCPQEMLMIY